MQQGGGGGAEGVVVETSQSQRSLRMGPYLSSLAELAESIFGSFI